MLIPLSNIVTNPEHNPRKGDLEGIAELAASIKANGLLQPILVRLLPHPPETYEVVAGHRRLAALRLLDPAGGLIECVVASSDNAHELALTENVMRQAMHPVDEYAAFAKLTTEGLKPKQIAKRFGLTEKAVRQRLGLGSLNPEWQLAWKEGLIDEPEARLLCQATAGRQAALFDECDGECDTYWLKSKLNPDRLSLDDKRLKLVGLDAYKKAGGKVDQDLFGDRQWLSDPELLDQLAENEIARISDEAASEGWAMVSWEYPDYQKVDVLHRVDAPTLEPEERAPLTCHLTIQYDGQVTRSYSRAKTKSAPVDGPVEKAGASMMAEPDLTKALSEDMSRVMTGFAHAYAQQESNRHTVLAMLAYRLTHPMKGTPLHVTPNTYMPTPVERPILATSWPDHSAPGSLEFIMGLETDDVVNLIWKAAATCFDFLDGQNPALRKQWYTLLMDNGEDRPEWTPTAENYFKRLTKEQILAAMKEMKPTIEPVSMLAAKKGELALIAERWAKETGWLPELLAPRLHADAENPPSGVEPLSDTGWQDHPQGGEVRKVVFAIGGSTPDPEPEPAPEPTVKEHVKKIIERKRRTVAERIAERTEQLQAAE